MAAALLFLVLLGARTGVAASADADPGREWCDGPVRYLLTKSESRRYRRLTTAEARFEFVAEFWGRLDPDPTAPGNEHKDNFERLCALADQRFPEPLTPGWRTDRGRVLILMGVPDSVRRDAGDPSGADREIWTYHGPPGGRAAAVEFVFHRDDDGLFRVGPLDDPFDPVDHQRTRQKLRQEIRLRMGTATPVEVELLTDSLMPRTTAATFGESGMPRTRRRDVTFLGPAPSATAGRSEVEFRDGSYYFRASDGSVLTLLALEVDDETTDLGATSSGPQGERPDAVAWVMDDWLEGRSLFEPRVTVVRFVRDREGSLPGVTRLTGRVYLEPGSYEVRYAVGHPDRLRIRSRVLQVPDFGAGGFSVSSVVPADRFGPATKGMSSPFTIGSEEVVPRPGGVFHKGEPLRIYLQVYGAARDPSTGASTVDVEFRFLRVTKGRRKRQGRPLSLRGAQGASMGLALPIGDWRPGDYRVVVDLHDRVSDARTATEGAFRIAE